MSSGQSDEGDQATRWNGAAGNAWVAAQDVLENLFRPLEELLVEEVTAAPGSRVLDVGCGTGATTLAIARRLGTSSRCVGLDISEPVVTAARERAEREQVPVSFIIGDAQEHAFDPGAFDAVVSRFGVMFFPDPVRAFANLRRAAADHALLRAIAWRGPEDNPFMTTAERAAAPLLPDLPVRRADEPGQFGFADADRVGGILRESGWSDVDIRPIDVTCVLPEAELVGYFTRLGPVGLRLREADEQTRAQVVAKVRPAFDPYVHGADVRFTAACWMLRARACAQTDHRAATRGGGQ
ncbi:class I SAM-dependent methyltransferase [Streptomyces sp. NPDC004082]|uniref:class I SAM-dependent methyltransferase n=1 Tax=unclassified Streptomyces TaxID=2593676 RepID=UPI0033ADF998